MQYTKVRSDGFQTIQMNAGIIADSFTPASGTIGNILGMTSGGFSFSANPSYSDFGEDVDNVPANTWQLKHLDGYDPAISGTFVSVDAATVKSLVGAATVTDDRIVPKNQLSEADFTDVWVIGDYSDKNEGANAGYFAVHLKNVLNTGGFQWQSTKDGKGQFTFDFHAHYDLTDIDDVPFEIYVKAGT